MAAEEWYFSNAAGMMLDKAPTRLTALRNTYCLSSARVPSSELASYLQQYYQSSYQIELNTLYEDGNVSHRQWIFRDARGIARVVASFSDESQPAAEEARETATLTGFIELYGEDKLITEEHQFSSGSAEKIINYFYNRQTLIRVETRLKTINADPEQEQDEPVISLITTDSYRYSRSNSLRAIERVYHEALSAVPEPEQRNVTRLQFPRLGIKVGIDELGGSSSAAYSSDFLQDILVKPGDKVVYTTNERGRVVSETRQNEAGEIQGEIRNTWTGDRLESVSWMSESDERRIEYEYDSAGDRIAERNYNKNVLERTVRKDNDREIEELYMDGEVILRAIWENGRKISEERVHPKR